MPKKKIPRIVIAGTSSGSGKTTVTCALLQALVNRGLKTASFKCGPDYIDPMFHAKVIGAESTNLDAFFCEAHLLRSLLVHHAEGCELSVIEGVMGFYDGMAMDSTVSSTYETAKITDSPALLVVGCHGMSNSVLAIIKGFLEFRSDHTLAGVILNQASPSMYPSMKSAIEKEFGHRLRVLGYLPPLPGDLILGSRHLGLITADEITGIKNKMQRLAEMAEKTLDIDGITTLARTAEAVEYEPIRPEKVAEGVQIGVAYDQAFCFYYRDNLELLSQMGAELVYFSPMQDRKLPEGIDGLYFGGGYPELHAGTLSENADMLASVREALGRNIPCIAECGGFMYLTESIEGHKMAGYLNGECANTGKLTRFGYVRLTANEDHLLCGKGEEIRGHEFHYYDCTANGGAFTARKESGKQWDCVVAGKDLYAGFPHLYFYSNPKFAENFIKRCAEHQKEVQV